jgi:hypothetical protein
MERGQWACEGTQRGLCLFDGGVHWRVRVGSGLVARRRLVTGGMLGIEASAGGWAGLAKSLGLAWVSLRWEGQMG